MGGKQLRSKGPGGCRRRAVVLEWTQLGQRRAIGLRRARWRWDTSSCARIDAVEWEASGQARRGLVKAGDKRLCSNGHGWVRDKQHHLCHRCQEGESKSDGESTSSSSSRVKVRVRARCHQGEGEGKIDGKGPRACHRRRREGEGEHTLLERGCRDLP